MRALVAIEYMAQAVAAYRRHALAGEGRAGPASGSCWARGSCRLQVDFFQVGDELRRGGRAPVRRRAAGQLPRAWCARRDEMVAERAAQRLPERRRGESDRHEAPRARHRRQPRHRRRHRRGAGRAPATRSILNYRSSDEAARARRGATSTRPAAQAELCPSTWPTRPPTAAALARCSPRTSRPIGVAGQQRRRGPRRALPGAGAATPGSVVTRTTLDGFYNVTQPLVMPMVRAPLGPHRQHLLGLGRDRQPRPGQLLGGQGRAHRRDPVAGAARSPSAASPSTRSRPG